MELSDSQRNTLVAFQEISHINDDNLCTQILQQHAWNLDEAVNQFVQGGLLDSASISNTVLSPRHPSTTPDTYRARGSSSSGRGGTANDGRSSTAVHHRNSSHANVFNFIFAPLRWLFQVNPVSMDPDRDTQKFIDEYDRKYGREHPPFHSRSYQSAVATAHRESKFLLVYLHSPMHEDSDAFCRGTLCATSVQTFASQHLLVWTGRIWDPEAYGLAHQLKASTFPFMALLVCQSSRAVQVADRIQGALDAPALLTRLNQGVGMFTTIINRQRLDVQRREEATLLREQQDREYQEAIAADREAMERRRQQEAEQAAAEEERKQQEELSQAMEMSRQLSKQDQIRKLRAYFESNPEPPVSAAGAGSGGGDVSTVRFQLPRGTKISRRFKKTDTVQVIFDFLKLHFAETATAASDEGDSDSGGGRGGGGIENFSVCTHFPKEELSDMGKTVEDVGLHPRGMLYVQDLDA